MWDNAKEKLFLEKLDEILAYSGGKQPTSQILDLWSTQFNSEFGGVFKECNHLRHEGLRNTEFYFNVFEKNHAAGASGYGSVTMGGGSTPTVGFDFSIDNSGTHQVLEEEITPTNGGRQDNTRRGPNDAGPSRSRGSAGKRKQRDATDEMTFSAMQEIVNHF
ncbi:hypothetical protein TIFTF001_050799 [Ficus carica]|uniref:Uncharacterized protein n=1 Tax=Ficus carica TaxID=3494 RepID=A0AA88CRR6_FICCA|nr:hypothetical protein TIFTF001_050793 [Ficus carica]GMN32372.1 hypothetical protein TIFTF001_050799 [Ficus carica]